MEVCHSMVTHVPLFMRIRIAAGCAYRAKKHANRTFRTLPKSRNIVVRRCEVNPGLLDSRCLNTCVGLQTPENRAPR
jgi:hypothetical protein